MAYDKLEDFAIAIKVIKNSAFLQKRINTTLSGIGVKRYKTYVQNTYFGGFIFIPSTYLLYPDEDNPYFGGDVMLVFHENAVKTTVSIPDYLHAYAKERKVSLSGSLTELLRKDYEERTGPKATNQTPALPRNPTTPGDTADD